MKKGQRIRKTLIFSALISTLGFLVSGCSSSNDAITLRIINWEDYIYLNNPSYGCDEPDLYNEQFKDYLKENYPEFKDKNIQVIYDTTDTNETLYSKMQTGKANYDLILASDYMIQKLMAEDKVVQLDKTLIPNYFPTTENRGYASQYLLDVTKGIVTTTYKTKETRSMYDFSVGYMWGTLGPIFNPTYSAFEKAGCNPISDFKEWTCLLDSHYKGTFSIKNSMRDTYSVGIMETFDSELKDLKNQYETKKISASEYNAEITEIFNRCDETNAKTVFNKLDDLKRNAFGFEVDSGKQDIVTKKIGAQISWSGDAIYSMMQAADRFQVSEPFELLYSIPSTGANIWFSSWAMPNVERTSDQFKLAHAFLNFLCDPFYAEKNMEYTGYTPAVGGMEIRDYVLDCYDARTALIYVLDQQPDQDVYYTVFYQNLDEGNELTEAWYSDCAFYEKQDRRYDNVPIKYYKGNYELNEEGVYIDSDTKEEITFESKKMVALPEKYNERFLISKDWDVVDLSYVFEGTIPDATQDDYIFYCESFFIEEGNNSVGGPFFAQYPDQDTIVRCMVMKDFRENNTTIMKLWEEFKSDILPTWAIVLFIFEGIIVLAIIGLVIYKRVVKKSLRVKRCEDKRYQNKN